MAASLLVVFGAVCLLGPLASAAASLAPALRVPRAPAVIAGLDIGFAAAAALALGLFQARCLQLCYPERFAGSAGIQSRRPRRKPLVLVAGLPISDDDLCTSVLVTGVTGSSKTAGVLLPLFAQLLQACDGRRHETLGAFIPEVKGDLVDAAIFLAREAGRDVARDVIVLSPSNRIPVVRYRDEEDRAWRLCARGGCAGSEAEDYLPELSPANAPAEIEALEDLDRCEPMLEAWRNRSVTLGRRRPRFVGWRWTGTGLRPIAGTDGRMVAPPRSLRVEAVEFFDSGVRYNLIDPRLPPTEMAERLTRAAAMARGGAAHPGENDYFYEQGRKLLSACLMLLRVSGTAEPTLIDLLRCATQDGVVEPLLEGLSERHRDLAAYFRNEWLRMVAEGKTATVIRSTLTASFGHFLHDPALAETFCRPSSFSFADIAQKGKIIGFVPGDRYEQLGRALGTACKLDFQSAMLARTSRSGLNTTRLAAYVADECHKYAAAGGAAAGDPYFMNLSRSNRVVNLCATQSYAWLVEVLGRDAANVYVSAFGVQYWLQQTDPETCRRAAEICGCVTRERVATEHELNFGGMMGAITAAHPIAIRRRRHEEEAARFRPEDFALLDIGECIGYNKGLPGRSGKVRRGRVRYLPCTSGQSGRRAVNAAVRDYYRELLEIRAIERGQDGAWDCAASPEEAEFAGYVSVPPFS